MRFSPRLDGMISRRSPASKISAIVSEEREHHDRSASLARAGTFWPKVLGPIVSAATEFVIWLGMRFEA